MLPAVAVVIALVALTLSMRTLDRELQALRRSLRRSQVTAVATDDLARTAARVRQQAIGQATSARRRLTGRPRWWDQQQAIDR